MIRLVPLLAMAAAVAAGDAAADLARYHVAVGRIDQQHDAAVAKERARTVGVLVGSAKAALAKGDAAAAAQVWRMVLVFDPEHAEARSFFQGIGRLDQVLAEVAALDPATLAGEAQVRLPPAAQRPVTREVSISAAAAAAGVLGPVRAGTSLQFAYVAGEWAPEERLSRSSPDRDPRPGFRLVIAHPDGRVVAQVPTGTAAKPFTWTAAQDFERLQLRILRAAPGAGSVRYRMTLIPPTAAASPKPRPGDR